jgi:hypothetical protein
VRLSPEFTLAVQCCRAAFAGRPAAPVEIRANGLDWPRFLKIAHFHGVEGLVWNALATVAMPDDAREELSTAAVRIAARSLGAAAECAALRDRFAASGISLLFLKGAALGSLAYGNPALKAAIDIDLLIDPASLAATADLLAKSGYRQVVPAADRPLSDWHRRSKESVWLNDSAGFQIDLHTRVADNPLLIPAINIDSPAQRVGVSPGQELPTFADEELFAYLVVHGGASTWFRLKWISDFAGYLNSKTPAEIEGLYRRSQELCAARAASQGLLLADRLFDTLAGNDDLLEELRRDRATRLLVDIAYALLSRDPAEPTDRLLGTVPLHLAPFLLRNGWRYKMAELSGQAGKLADRFAF